MVLLLPTALHADDSLVHAVENSVRELNGQLHLLRTTEEDCSIKPRWELPLTIPEVENFLTQPLSAPVRLSSFSCLIIESSNASPLVQFAMDILSNETTSKNPSLSISSSGENEKGIIAATSSYNRLPLSLRNSISRIAASIQTATPLLKKSFENLSADERRSLLSLHSFPVDEKFETPLFTPRSKKKIYESAKKLNTGALLQAASIVAETVEGEMNRLKEIAVEYKSTETVWLKSDAGGIIISGNGTNLYDEEFLKNAALLIDFGGKNRYEGSVAGAREGEIKIVIDFGDDVTVASTQNVVSAGAGIYGIGLFYLVNPQGIKTVVTNSFSQGAGVCGVGGMFVNGSGHFRGNRYVQGVGLFGLGIFSCDRPTDTLHATQTLFETNLYGQGVGFTRGIGIFRHNGSNATFLAGLIDPDPREPLGTTSLCQGVGHGPRGYAGGGLGLCVLKGNNLNLESSYFAQGAGYWRAAGSFFIEGSSNSVKARRYDQGSGIHGAVGSFILKGDNNHIINWGVGPAFGWDTGIGWGLFYGNNNNYQAEWGAGTASINNSRSFSLFSGDNCTFDLPGLGGGQYTRDLVDYSVSIINGRGNRLRHPAIKHFQTKNQSILTSAWGALKLEDVSLLKDVGFKKAEWSRLPQDEFFQREGVNLAEEIEKAKSLMKEEKIEKWLQVASAFSVDKAQPRKALAQLLSVPDDETAHIIKNLEPADVDGLIQIRNLTGILGEVSAKPILNELKTITEERRAALLYLLSYLKAEDGIPILLQDLADNDWRIQTTAARIIGLILNDDNGNVPGRITILRVLEKWLNSGSPSKDLRAELLERLTSRSFAETVSTLMAGKFLSVPERIALLELAPPDINETLAEKEAGIVLDLLRKDRAETLKRIRDEIKCSESLKKTARKKLAELIQMPSSVSSQQPKRELINAVIVALGQVGNSEDAEIIAHYMNHSSALVREGVSASLGRIGKGSLKFLKQAMKSPDVQTRAGAVIAVGKTADASLATILRQGLEDKDPFVRNIALTTIEQLQNPLAKEKQKLREKVKASAGKSSADPSNLQTIYLYGM